MKNISFAFVMIIFGWLWTDSVVRSAMQESPIRYRAVGVVHMEEMEYPPLARQTRIQGVVVIRVTLNKVGDVVSSEALFGHPLLVEGTLVNSRKWKFKPNSQGKTILVYDFGFDNSLCPHPCPSTFRFRPPNFVIVRSGGVLIDHGPGVSDRGVIPKE
jgi:TonB family protein